MDTMLTKKQSLLLVLVAIIAIGLLSFLKFNSGIGLKQQANLIIFFDDQHQRSFQGEVKDGMSVLTALEASSKAGKFDVRYAIEKNGEVKLYSIADKINETDKKWVFFLNDKIIDSKSIGITDLRKSDIIEAKYK